MNDQPSIISGGFNKPFPEQIAFFKDLASNLITADKLQAMESFNRERGFFITGAAKSDFLADIARSLTKALEQGKGLEDFKKEFRQSVANHGWSAWENLDKKQQAWRIKTIFTHNAAMSYSGGRYQQLQNFKFWVYYHSDLSRVPRLKHLSWHGLTLEKDHLFWKSHFPRQPKAFGCNCNVVGTNSLKGAKRLGGDPDKKLQDGTWTVPTGRPFYTTGHVHVQFDKHASTPDCLDFDITSLTKKQDCLKPTASQANWKDIGRPDLRHVDDKWKQDQPTILDYAPDRKSAHDMLATILGVSAVAPTKVIETPVEQVLIHYDLLEHMVEKEADKRERFANFILPTLVNPFEIWNTEYEDTLRRRYIGLFHGKTDLLVSVRVNKDGSFFWNMMYSDHRRTNRQRLGALIYAMDNEEGE